MLNLNDREWKAFELRNIFENFHGKRLVKTMRKKGAFPLLTAGNTNNGVTEFINNSDMNYFQDFISVDMFGNAFYHPYNATGDDNIYFFKCDKLSKYIKLFIVACINNQKVKFSYGKQFRQYNADNMHIMLPVAENGQPDYAFMEQYIREREVKLKQKYINYINDDFQIPKITLCAKKWKPFSVLDLFDYKRGNQNNMNSLADGNDMLISAKNINNGLKGFYMSTNDKKGTYKGNCITMNNDGDGGVGLAYYQPYNFLLDTHVYALYSKENINYFVMLYLSQTLSKQRVCFSHGYSISQDRLKAMKIMLPTTDKGNPDYEYMEQYVKALMLGKYKKYLEYQNCLIP